MKVDVKDAKNAKTGSLTLPPQFEEEVRKDLVKRAVLAVQSHNRQAYGASPDAGMRHSAELSRRRRKYRGSYGFGISRVPRKILSRNGTRMHWVGAVAPGTVGGRRAHAPKADKIWDQKINTKERRKAIRAGLSAAVSTEYVQARGHKLPAGYPFALDNAFEALTKTKEVAQAFEALGLGEELVRSSVKKVRPGRGKARGRKYKTSIGPLVVVSSTCPITKSAKNIPGVSIRSVKELDAEVLAPGAQPGRLTLFTQAALEELDKQKLYM